MTKDNATPRPWKNTGRDIESESGIIGSCYGESDVEESANARLIVKAVNCHDDFISLAQSVMKLDCPEHIHVMAYQLLKKASE